MNQTESSMSEGYSFFNNLSAGSDKINSVSRDCVTRSSSSISSSPSSTSYFIVYNNNNVITKDHPPPLQKQYLRSQKGLRSPHHLQQSQQNHMSTLSWSSASCDSSEISYDSINSDSTNESITTTTTTTTAPSSSSTTSSTTTTTSTTSTTSSTQKHQQQPTKSDTITSNTTTTTNAPTNGQLVSTLCVASRDSTLTTPTQPISTPTKTSAHPQQHINSENRKPGYLPCTPTPRSFRYPSFISFNHISSEMGRPNSYDSFEYQQYQQYQQFVQQQQQKYQQQLLQNISDDNEGCVSDQHDETSSNQQNQQESSSISDIEPQEQQQQQANQESSSSSTENQSSQHQESCSSNEHLSSQPQQEQEQEQESSIEIESQQQTPSTTVLNTNSTSLVTSTSSSSASENESSSEDEMELPENCHYSPPKSVDRDAASRLAKRLYNLEGFKRSDVCRHLSKNNDFSRIVAEEYLKFFNFEGDTLDGALRKFLFSFCLIGETQERERVLQHFSKRYLDCNPDTLKSADALHTLTCAIMLLNTDLHGENVGRKMTCNEFIDNLSDLNDGQNFPRDVLVSIYQSIKAQPLKWALDEDAMVNGVNSRIGLFGSGLSSSSVSSSSSSSSGHLSPGGILGSNPFLKLPNPNTATEYKRGYIMRKCCFDMNGKRTPFGKRGWKMFYATLRDLVLFLHKDEQGGRKNQLYESLNNSIRIHHAMAAPATDYTKKQYVFRLQTADQSEYLFQTSDAQELQSWIDTINLVAGTLSAPLLPSAVGSQSKKFQKPLLPSSHTKFNTKEQLADHEVRIQRIAQELEEHVSKHPDKGAQRRLLNEYAEKQSYLESELKRYSAYASILRIKLQQVLGSGALLEGPSKLMTPLSSKSKPLTQLSIGEEQDIDEEKWAEDGHEYQEQISVQPVKRSHR